MTRRQEIEAIARLWHLESITAAQMAKYIKHLSVKRRTPYGRERREAIEFGSSPDCIRIP